MPSPVGHTLFGLTIYVLWCKNLRKWLNEWYIILWIIFCANLPDIDFFIGVALGDMNRFHQVYTHTLGFALVAGLIVYAVKKNYRISLLTFIAVYTHVILDSLNHDTRPPIGVMLFWPFSNKHFNPMQIFYAVPHLRIYDIFSSFFMKAVMHEVLLLFVPLLVLILWKKSGRT